MIYIGINSNVYTNFGPQRISYFNGSEVLHKSNNKIGNFEIFNRKTLNLITTKRSFVLCDGETKIHGKDDHGNSFVDPTKARSLNLFYDIIDGQEQYFIKPNGEKVKIEPNFCELFGFISCYCISVKKLIDVSNKEIDFNPIKNEVIFNKIFHSLKKINGGDGIDFEKSGESKTIKIADQNLSNYIDSVIYSNGFKKIPKFILRNTIENKKRFLKGFIEIEDVFKTPPPDGKDYLFYSSYDINYCNDVFSLLTSIGIHARLSIENDYCSVHLAAGSVIKSLDHIYDLISITVPKCKYREDEIVSISQVDIDCYGIDSDRFYCNGYYLKNSV